MLSFIAFFSNLRTVIAPMLLDFFIFFFPTVKEVLLPRPAAATVGAKNCYRAYAAERCARKDLTIATSCCLLELIFFFLLQKATATELLDDQNFLLLLQRDVCCLLPNVEAVTCTWELKKPHDLLL